MEQLLNGSYDIGQPDLNGPVGCSGASQCGEDLISAARAKPVEHIAGDLRDLCVPAQETGHPFACRGGGQMLVLTNGERVLRGNVLVADLRAALVLDPGLPEEVPRKSRNIAAAFDKLIDRVAHLGAPILVVPNEDGAFVAVEEIRIRVQVMQRDAVAGA